MQLYLGELGEKILTKTHFGHNSEARAIKWNVHTGVDWPELMRVSRRIQSHVRRRMAIDRVPGRPILPQAAQLWKRGYLLKEGMGAPWHWESSGLVRDAK